MEFVGFPKMARLSRDIVITEKIDGTSGSICITPENEFLVGSRTRWITPGKNTDNYGFAEWAYDNEEELRQLGPGQHFGEWWGRGIQRGYGSEERAFSLFNTARWNDPLVRPACCDIVPELYAGPFDTAEIDLALDFLSDFGSCLPKDCCWPAEGIVIYHTAANICFKKTLENDSQPKSLVHGS